MNIRAELMNLPTSCLSDASGTLNNMDPGIRPLDGGYKLCGPALTVRLNYNDNKAVLRAIRRAEEGQVLVIDSKGLLYNTVAGDFVIGMAKVMGIAGVVVDGTIRDVDGVKKVGLPVFCRGTTIAVGGKAGVGEIGVPISCGGAVVQPGDWIVGDADGVTVIPLGKLEEVIERAGERERKDAERSATVLVSKEAVCRYLDGVLAE